MTNNNYKQAKYTSEISLPRSAEVVFSHLANLRHWWPEDFEGEDIVLNTEFIFKTGDGHYSKNKVTEFEPGKKLAWITTESLRKSDHFDWTGTRFIFEIMPRENDTLLRFTYDGVILENESERLVQICDLTLQEFFYSYIINGKGSNTMESKDYTITITLHRPAADVFKAITDDVVKWWGGKDLRGSSSALNDEFVIHHPGAHYSKQVIEELIPGEKVVWLVTESELSWLQNDKHEWTDTRMIFELIPDGGKTLLRFTHLGLAPEKECYAMCTDTGWAIVIGDYLYHYVNDGNPHF